MGQSSIYNEIVSACERFIEDRRVESLERLIPQARLFDYGFRSLVGPLEITRGKICEVYHRSQNEIKWHLDQILDQLDELGMLRQVEVPNDFRAITVHFAFSHKALHSIKANLEKACTISDEGLEQIVCNFNQAMESVAATNGIYVTNWREPKEWNTLFVPDVGLNVVKLIYANWHSINLALIPKKVGIHKHRDTSEIHFSLEPTDGDQVVGRFRVRVTDPHAVPIEPNEWHAYVENRTSRPHQLLFLTGSPQILGWGIVNDRTVTDPSKLALTYLGPGEIEKIGGVLLEKAIRDSEYLGSKRTFLRELIGASSTGGINLSIVAIPETWSGRSQDIIHLVVRGTGELNVRDNRVKVREGDVFAIPFDMTYNLKNEGTKPLILLGSTLEHTRSLRHLT